MDITQLKRVLPTKWRVQQIKNGWATCVAYIDARDAQDLLDEVVGPENWQSDYKEVKGNVYGGVGIRFGDEWVWKWDCGVESNTEGEKGEASDSFKRACVKWGLGRFLYSLEIKRIKTVEKNGKHYPADDRGNILWDKEQLTDYINTLSNKSRRPDAPQPPSQPAPAPAPAAKPKLSNKGFMSAVERIGKGEKELFKTVTDAYAIEEQQMTALLIARDGTLSINQ